MGIIIYGEKALGLIRLIFYPDNTALTRPKYYRIGNRCASTNIGQGKKYVADSVKQKEKQAVNLKIGGMALENGVLFQTDTHWAMAIRDPSGEIEISSGRKTAIPGSGRMRRIPLLRGLISLAESGLVIPSAYTHGGRLPLPTRSPQMLASMIVSVLGTMVVRNPKRKLPPLVEEVAVSALTLIPSLIALRKTEAIEYHAAEHKSINAWESSGSLDESNAREALAEHPRCGSNIMGPALAMMTVGNTLTRRWLGSRRGHIARLGVGVLSLSGAVEMVQWASRNPGSILSKALTLPGGELQHLVTTGEPTHEQLAVGLAALGELLKLEGVPDSRVDA